jgi:uncharacterized protein (DUF952 family)/uncharacterized protein YqgV (UPF0045/DUF77 family)
MIYHITSKQAWQNANKLNKYECESLFSEGFIHCSMPHQIIGVLDRYYKGVSDLVLLYIDETKLSAPLKVELAPSINDYFPHIFGPILPAEVVKIVSLNDSSWKQELFIVNAAIQIVPMQVSKIAYPLVDEVIEIIQQFNVPVKTTAFNTSVEATMPIVLQIVEKINAHLFLHAVHCDWLCNVQIHASNQGPITENQKIK